MNKELMRIIQSYDRSTALFVRVLLETNPMNREAIEAHCSDLTCEEIQKLVLDYLNQNSTLDSYSYYVCKLASKKKFANMNEDQQQLVEDIKIRFEIPDFKGIESEAKRKYFNEVLIDLKLGYIEEDIENYDDTGELKLGENMLSCFIYDFLFYDDLNSELEIQKAKAQAIDNIFRGIPIKIK